jgi:hypothetical protein
VWKWRVRSFTVKRFEKGYYIGRLFGMDRDTWIHPSQNPVFIDVDGASREADRRSSLDEHLRLPYGWGQNPSVYLEPQKLGTNYITTCTGCGKGVSVPIEIEIEGGVFTCKRCGVLFTPYNSHIQ